MKNIVEGYENYTGSDLKVQNTLTAMITTLSKGNLEETDNIDK